jgi:hypothetical protein
MKLDFDFTLVTLDGLPLTDENGIELHAARTAARLIMRSMDAGADVMTSYDWATQLHKTGTIDLDRAGQQQFRSMFEKMPNVPLAVRGQLLEVLSRKQNDLTEK